MEKYRRLGVVLLVFVPLAGYLTLCFCGNSTSSSCYAEELEALVKFQASLLSWSLDGASRGGNDTKCCRWNGISCDKDGRVMKIETEQWMYSTNTSLTESLHPLLELRHLNHLDLTGIICDRSCMIPEFLGSMKQLRFLGLPRGLSGKIPHHMGNLTNLRALILVGGWTSFLTAETQWLSNLVYLTRLDLEYVDVVSTADLSRALGTLPSLTELTLISCGLEEGFLQQGYSNSALVDKRGRSDHLGTFGNRTMRTTSPFGGNLELLIISNDIEDPLPDWLRNLSNNIGGPFPDWLRNLKHLQRLELTDNQLIGEIPVWLGELTTLVVLDLSGNGFSGSIPSSVGRLSHLFSLDLSRNRFSGSVPSTVGRLSYLNSLDLSRNSLDGVITEAHFSNLSKLKELDLSENRLTIELDPQWAPPFQLWTIRMGSCILTNRFPHWVRTQNEARKLHLPNASISNVLPEWIGELRLSYLNLSNSGIFGPLPNLPKELSTLDISHNSISGSLGRSIANLTWMDNMDVHDNMIGGSIPHSLCNWTFVFQINLSKNRFVGIIPDCWNNSMFRLDFSFNELSGPIPASIGRLDLCSLHLNDNHLQGELPLDFIYLNRVVFMDLGGNNLEGNIQDWIQGMNFPVLQILRLRENDFHGEISSALCTLELLQVLDLAGNRLTGNIPRCLGLMRGFNLGRTDGYRNGSMPPSPSVGVRFPAPPADWNREHVDEVIKGRDDDYTRIDLQLITNLDLSSNDLVGSIPDELGFLFGLRGLNLSHNRLYGTIPSNVGEMKSIESLDLSDNLLFGRIPLSVAALTSLSHLNLSHNNLSGEIPKGSQIQTLEDPSNFAQNPLLCAEFLPRKCHLKALPPLAWHPGGQQEDYDEDKLEKILFYVIVVSGFACGFWGAVGSLVLNKNWRRSYFTFADQAVDWVYVTVAVKAAELKRRLRST